MKSIALKKLSLYLSLALLFCSLPVVHVEASSVSDQSKPIFGLTADDVVDKYNQLNDQQKDQVLRSLGNTSIFANSLFGNIFNSTFGVLDDAIEKIGDLFFQANGVIYKLGSSALAWISRLIDKVFDNDLNDLNISQPVINDLYLNTRGLEFYNPPFFSMPHMPTAYNGTSTSFSTVILPLPDTSNNYCTYNVSAGDSQGICTGFSRSFNRYGSNYVSGLIVDLDSNRIFRAGSFIPSGNGYVSSISNVVHWVYQNNNNNGIWYTGNWFSTTDFITSFSGDYHNTLLNVLNTYYIWLDGYYVRLNGFIEFYPLTNTGEYLNVTNNTYYNYIYNIPDQTPLNVTNIVSNTSIDYSPSNNIAYYLPDQYNIEQNFTVVNNYYISSGSAITSQGSIDVILVSPSVIDVRIINPEDISSEVINENNNDIINNYDFNFGDLNITNSVGTGINNAKDNLADVVTTSSINAVAGFGTSGLPDKWRYAIFGFFAFGIIALVITRRGIAH